MSNADLSGVRAVDRAAYIRWSRISFFIKLSQKVSPSSPPFAAQPVIVQLSDFQSNEAPLSTNASGV